jgi:predicted AlkP superfamily phosphohydrolase/phosphomutase
MPFVTRLRGQGLWGRLASTDPPITVPAWTAMLSGLDPGQLGLYGFRNRTRYDYDSLAVASAATVQAPRLWDMLGQAGLSSIVLGVPQTYPPRPLHGLMVAGFLTPDEESEFTYPRELKARLAELCGGPYQIDVRDFRQKSPEQVKEEVWNMTRRRFSLARGLLSEQEWDFFMLVEMGPDRLHHGFWGWFDPGHRLYKPGNPYENVIPAYYEALDQEIASLVNLMPEGALILIVSDHGAQAMQGGLAINEWLIQRGYLRLKQPVLAQGPLKPEMVDWPKTLAWGEGGYYSRIFFNLAGREPQGALDPCRAEEFSRRLVAELKAMVGPEGRPLGNRVLVPAHIYRELNGLPPDLILYPGNLAWRALGGVGRGRVFFQENDQGIDHANHAPFGILAAAVKGRDLAGLGGQGAYFSIYDVAPTVLSWFGLPVPSRMIGRVLEME